MPVPFSVYNTLSRQTEAFEPTTPGEVKLYVCGMTVYDHAHVGHARAMVVFDTFSRWLQHRGWKVTFVRNFTDVDDKIIRRAQAESVGAMEIAERYIASFHEDCAAMGLLPPTHEPRVSTSIPGIVAMIGKLIDQGHAYAAGGSVWFNVPSFEGYGKLSNQTLAGMQCSADEGHKHDAHDFALWKGSKPGEPAWESPWGPGRPGWHIECSAMALETLGVTIDIHGGGLDLVFPHHENEVAQSECANRAPYARIWMHNGLLTLARKGEEAGGQAAKMGKSLGNAFGIKEALRAFPAEALRLYYLGTHYRSPLPWSDDSLPEALSMLGRLYEAREAAEAMVAAGIEGSAGKLAKELGEEAMDVLRLARELPAALGDALDEDLNTAAALGHVFELARAVNRLANKPKVAKRAGPIAAEAIGALDLIRSIGLLTQTSEEFQAEVKQKRLGALGLDAAAVEQRIAARAAAREAKDWAAADAVRQDLDAMGIVVMDRADGVAWKVRIG